jgi:hypothetical protein
MVLHVEGTRDNEIIYTEGNWMLNSKKNIKLFY